MGHFDAIYAIAAARKGDDAALEALIAEHRPKTHAEIGATPDDRILALMTKRVFQAGFSWKVIENKWPGFETAFEGFDPRLCAAMSEETFDALLRDARIVRNAQKILSVQANARFLLDLAAEHGSAAAAIADWPDDDYAGLLEFLKTRASRLGGESAMRFLRDLGKPSFITSRDVTAALIREGVLTRPPSGKRDMQAVQAAFNGWAKESGRDLTAISRVLAMSV
ncbi:MAG TPA: DNA-3-methyladenine glycosylase I [Caulobacteraceae bacterium]|jgi:3-methyladenine DNA glycosylase Tag|nr:DNA-3-methyladenine glycosylase I [Caulobacteraceae bacterium]